MINCWKPDIDRAKLYWKAYWAGEIIDRPCICIKAFRNPEKPPRAPRGLNGFGDWDEALAEFETWASEVVWLGEAIPSLLPNFGPDQFAAWLGSDLCHSSLNEEQTSWAVPSIYDWSNASLESPRGKWWDQMLAFMRRIATYSHGRFLPAVPDIHSNIDALVALRGVQNLCLDIYDTPEQIDVAMKAVRRAFPSVFLGIEEAGELTQYGYTSWLPFYCENRMSVLQCDFACFIGPEQFRRWAIPALEEEAAFLSHSVYHYDGPGALVHLEDILAIKRIDAIQWVPGEGNPPPIEWMDLLLRIQKVGKGLYIGASCEEVKIYHKTLRPEGVLYDVWASSEHEGEELLAWLRENT